MYIAFKSVLKHLEDLKSVINSKTKAKNSFKDTKELFKNVLSIFMIHKRISGN